MNRPTSRRDLFRAFLRKPAKSTPATPPPEQKKAPTQGDLALILDHFCLAHQGSFCSTCVERCPEPGAMSKVDGKPVVHAYACTGCGVCQEVCPAPKNAIFFVARAPKPGMIGKTVDETKPDASDV